MRRSPRLEAEGFAQGFGDRRDGVSRGVFAAGNVGFNGDDPAAVRENRARFARRVGAMPGALCSLRQVHGAAAVAVTAPAEGVATGDALVSRTPGLLLAVTTADCVPILIGDVEAGVAAAIHAGWRGAVAGVVGAAVGAMEAQGARRERLVAAIGPAIRQPSYEVDVPLRDAVLRASPDAAHFLVAGGRADRFQFDLPGYCRHLLHAAGAKEVDDLGVDTLEQDHIYFSHRRSKQRNEGGYGLQMSGIVVPA